MVTKKQSVHALKKLMAQAQKQVDSGKLKGWPLQQAKNKVTSLRYRINHYNDNKPKVKGHVVGVIRVPAKYAKAVTDYKKTKSQQAREIVVAHEIARDNELAALKTMPAEDTLTIVAKKPRRLTKLDKQRQPALGQGFLPSFLAMMDMVRIEELVADRIFKALMNGRTSGVAVIDQVIKDEARTAAKAAIFNLSHPDQETQPDQAEVTFPSERKARAAK